MNGRSAAGAALAAALFCAIVIAALLGGRGPYSVAADTPTPPAIQWCVLATPAPTPTPTTIPTLLPAPSATPTPTPTPAPDTPLHCQGDVFAS